VVTSAGEEQGEASARASVGSKGREEGKLTFDTQWHVRVQKMNLMVWKGPAVSQRRIGDF
jgi:hypothetical protein